MGSHKTGFNGEDLPDHLFGETDLAVFAHATCMFACQAFVQDNVLLVTRSGECRLVNIVHERGTAQLNVVQLR